jgi:CheY-like chemotaxis protein
MKDGKYVILTIDDDPEIIDAIAEVIEDNNHTMLAAYSAKEGLALYKKHNPDLIFVDMMMEEVDSGIKFFNELKLLASKTPVILISGVGDGLCNVADCSQLGFKGVLQKPFKPEQIINFIKKLS